jgi:uncharacterized OB-fold protein
MVEKRPKRPRAPYFDEFWKYCNQGEFRLQVCNKCGEIEFPPSPVCPSCIGSEFTWKKMKGTGEIVSHVTFIKEYYAECPPPWPAVLVALDEGPWVMSNPKNMSEADMKKGTRVKVTFVDAEDEFGQFKIPLWEKA